MTEPTKPLFRGRVHQIAFYKTIALTFIFSIKFILARRCCFELIVYLISQLILYGVSSTYHLTEFKTERIRRIFQKLDHSSIFILIAGTQTSVFLALQSRKTIVTFLFLTWGISLIGILKIFLFNKIVEVIDVMIYIGHGVCVVPFINVLREHLRTQDLVMFGLGGLVYIIGGVIFGTGWPDPYPTVFGYHEVFHVLTVIANICMMVPIVGRSMSK